MNRKDYFMNVLYYKLLSDEAKPPYKKYDDDAGIDLFCIEDVDFNPFEIKSIRTGVCLQLFNTDKQEVHSNLFIKLWDRSSIAKTPLLTKGGVIDLYTGEIIVIMQNISLMPYSIKKNTKLVQAIVLVKPTIGQIVEVDELIETERGDKGFGSTGS